MKSWNHHKRVPQWRVLFKNSLTQTHTLISKTCTFVNWFNGYLLLYVHCCRTLGCTTIYAGPMKSLVSSDVTSRSKWWKISSIWWCNIQFYLINTTTRSEQHVVWGLQEAGLRERSSWCSLANISIGSGVQGKFIPYVSFRKCKRADLRGSNISTVIWKYCMEGSRTTGWIRLLDQQVANETVPLKWSQNIWRPPGG